MRFIRYCKCAGKALIDMLVRQTLAIRSTFNKAKDKNDVRRNKLNFLFILYIVYIMTTLTSKHITMQFF